MKLNQLTILLIACIIFIPLAISPVKAQTPKFIMIYGDGSVSDPNAIQRTGNTYSLTHDLPNASIVVLRNNVILDGEGYTIQGGTQWLGGSYAINLTCTNTTIQNFRIVGFWEVGILGNYNGNTIYNNNITKTDRAISIYANDYNITGNYLAGNDVAVRIVGSGVNTYGNTVINNEAGVVFTNSSGNTIVGNDFERNGIAVGTNNGECVVYHNNFINQTIRESNGDWLAMVLSTGLDANVTLPPWDNGYPSGGNYWSDYASRYPNATEIDVSGIGDTAYVIGYEGSINSTAIGYFVEAIDRYPALTPFNISEVNIELPAPTPEISPSPLPTSTLPPATATPSTSTTNLPTELILLLLMIILIGLGFILYLKKNRQEAPQNIG
jgi:parallel beta-helix repeat protein